MAATQDDVGFDFQPELPIGISCVGDRYLLFDVKIATFLRRQHNICGMTIGTLPLAPSQNIFLGMPIEIMPEEAQLLVEKGVAFIVDDARAHDQAIQSADKARRADYLSRLQKQARRVEEIRAHEKAVSKKRGLEKQSKQKSSLQSKPTDKQSRQSPSDSLLDFGESEQAERQTPQQESEIKSSSTITNPTSTISSDESPVKILPTTTLSTSYEVTPATSRLLLHPHDLKSPQSAPIKNLPSSYPLYRHLHDKGYFATPGLRFGCQYTVYPGDPLRFHSHFLAVGIGWDDEFDLVDVVGGGRLGTGVKKGFLLGGQTPLGNVRTFSIEWAAM